MPRHVGGILCGLAITTWLGCLAIDPTTTPEHISQLVGEDESPLVLTVECARPLVVEDWATVTVRLTNSSEEPVQIWLRTWDDGRETLPIYETFRHIRYDMVRRAVPGGANTDWVARMLAPTESLDEQLSFHVQLLYEGDHELVHVYDPLALENVPQKVKDAPPITASSNPLPLRIANGNRIPEYDDDCADVPALHPELTLIPEVLNRKATLLLIDWTPENMSGLSEWAQKNGGIRLASTASPYRRIVQQGQIGLMYGAFITCDIRSAPLHRIFDVVAHLWKPDVRWRFKDGVVTFYEDVPIDTGSP